MQLKICIFLLLIIFQALSCLVQIASVRRSLFNNTERAKFLNNLVTGVRTILDNPQVNITALFFELNLSALIFLYLILC